MSGGRPHAEAHQHPHRQLLPIARQKVVCDVDIENQRKLTQDRSRFKDYSHISGPEFDLKLGKTSDVVHKSKTSSAKIG